MVLDEDKEEEDKEDGGCVGSWSHEEENSTALPSRNKKTNVSNTRNLPPSTYVP